MKAEDECLEQSLYQGKVLSMTNHVLQLVNGGNTYLEQKHVYTHTPTHTYHIHTRKVDINTR